MIFFFASLSVLIIFYDKICLLYHLFHLLTHQNSSACKGQDTEISGVASGHWTGLIHWPFIHCFTCIKINV